MSITNDIVEGEFKGIKYKIYNSSDGLAREMYQYYEVEVRDKYWNMKKGDVIVDVGSMYGEYAILGLLTGAEKAYCFDPSTDKMDYIRNVAKLNGIDDNRLITHDIILDNIRQYRLDDWISSHIDWIKIDVEGMELDVLEGARKTIKESKPNLLVELHHFIDKDIQKKVIDYIILELDYSNITIDPYHIYFDAGNDASHLFARAKIP